MSAHSTLSTTQSMELVLLEVTGLKGYMVYLPRDLFGQAGSRRFSRDISALAVAYSERQAITGTVIQHLGRRDGISRLGLYRGAGEANQIIPIISEDAPGGSQLSLEDQVRILPQLVMHHLLGRYGGCARNHDLVVREMYENPVFAYR